MSYRFNRPITAALVLAGPILAPIALLGMLIRDTFVAGLRFVSELPGGIALLHREAVEALRWSIVEPAQAQFARVRAQLSAGRAVTAEKASTFREALADRTFDARMFIRDAADEFRYLKSDIRSALGSLGYVTRNLRYAATTVLMGRPA